MNTFVLKTYFTTAAEKHYNAEVEAFRRLGSNPSIIGFYGSFTRGDTYNVLLEYADKGTLEEYFYKVIPPVDPDEIINFWQALFKIIDALRRIHQVNPDGNGGPPLIFQGYVILPRHLSAPADFLFPSQAGTKM
jgi:serine/threonine protein kinase